MNTHRTFQWYQVRPVQVVVLEFSRVDNVPSFSVKMAVKDWQFWPIKSNLLSKVSLINKVIYFILGPRVLQTDGHHPFLSVDLTVRELALILSVLNSRKQPGKNTHLLFSSQENLFIKIKTKFGPWLKLLTTVVVSYTESKETHTGNFDQRKNLC